MKKRYKKRCERCNKIFTCSGHCSHLKDNPECLCWDCDSSDEEWLIKCGKNQKFNPSFRESFGRKHDEKKI